jgi:hypothetical protein
MIDFRSSNTPDGDPKGAVLSQGAVAAPLPTSNDSTLPAAAMKSNAT